MLGRVGLALVLQRVRSAVHPSFVLDLFAVLCVGQLVVSMLLDDVSDAPCIYLPFGLPLVSMFFKHVLVGNEGW